MKILRNTRKYTGFTLVELIVVITILVILGTIGFMSLSGYSGNARDSSRISDLNNIAKALDITYQKTNSYPLPDNYFNITYSGGNVWHQGNVSEGVIAILNNGGGLKLSKKPTDPLTTSKEYTYSKLSYGYAYQIKANWEGESVASYFPHSTEGGQFFNQAQASTGNPTITYVKGNYNGVVAKTQTGNLIYILAVPSIVTSTGVTYLSSIDMGAPANSLSGTLLIHGGSNITGVSYNPKLIYSSGSLPKTQTEQILFASGIATAYSGTPLALSTQIKPFTMALGSNDTTTIASLGGGILTSALGGTIAPSVPPVFIGATGGSITYTDSSGLNPRSSPAYAGGYTVHTFTSVGTDAFQVIGTSISIDYLVVAGGGAGGYGDGSSYGGGGGAGGMLQGSVYPLVAGTYSITVGSGGNISAANGNPSSFNSVFNAIGGGGGGTAMGAGKPGGSGGGASGGAIASGGVGSQGYNGGNGSGGPQAGMGGGAGGAGGINTGIGGLGLSSSITGSPFVYATGGGYGGSAVPNSGNGGGGTASSTFNVGSSGVVIVRYHTP